MKRYMNIIIAMILFILVLSCKDSEVDFEVKALNDVFPELTKRVYVRDIYPPPPPPKPPLTHFFVENADIIMLDSINKRNMLHYNLARNEYNRKIDLLQLDTNFIVLSIYDSLINKGLYLGYVQKDLPSKDYLEAFIGLRDITKSSLYINVNKISNTKYKLEYVSAFPDTLDLWQTKYPHYYAGKIYISRIHFDSTKNYGVFYCEYRFGGFVLCIKKEDEKWVIDETLRAWIS
ncbi:MAG: hypothetical protein GQ527_12050 [Bacteroidales bacterium]|nr:hypothetical protein [Bacteroidales bacterium]